MPKNPTVGSRQIAFLSGDASLQERMRIDGSGNVGIGTANPESLLNLFGNNPELKIRQDPSISGGGTLTITGAGNNDNKVRVVMHGITLESASGAAQETT